MKIKLKTSGIVIVFIWVLMPLTAHAQERVSLSLEDAIEAALEENREIRIAKYGVEAAESGLREATGGFFPEVSLSGQYMRNVKKPVIFLGDGGGFPGMEGGPSRIEVGSNNSYQAGLSATVPV